MIEKEVIVKGLKINYKVFGQGRPFLILHGWGSDSQKWEKTAELLSRKNLFVIVPDLPGFGVSQKPQTPWSIDNYVDWLFDFSKNIGELNNDFYLLGHSFGGALAAKFSIRHGQKVNKLFLCSAAAVRKKTFKKKILGTVSGALKIFSFLPFYSLAKKAFYKFVVGASDYLKTEGVMKETFLKAIDDDLSHKLSFIKAPVVILWGQKDNTTPLEDGYWIHKKIINSKLEIIAGADHAPYIKMPEILAEKILEYV